MPTRPVLTARTADPRRLYELAVQCPQSELDFVSARFRALRKRPLRRIREDFCGSAFTASQWVRRHRLNTAVGIDLDASALKWGEKHHLADLSPDARARIRLIKGNVLTPTPAARGVDAVLAMNFSWSVFKTREALRGYFKTVRRTLARDGVLFMDIHGGYESMKELTERRRCAGFTYVWDQAAYDPITGDLTCHIHFDFKKGPMLKKAFTYHWRMWTLPEVRELLTEAGFRRVRVYWEGENKHGNGTGEFRERAHGKADASFVCYVSAER
jgi:hypothetical protein